MSKWCFLVDKKEVGIYRRGEMRKGSYDWWESVRRGSLCAGVG